jgi:hypothetical protein|tara:strand:+ start:1368 stop:1976 length:609 start_codon:yes stop_codon:yes gene_type:complete
MFISPYEIFNKNDEDKFAIIVDCKNTETPSRNMSLDQQLGLLTLASAQKQGFSNIVLFEDREDFDIAVSELTKMGVWKIIYVFSGTMFGDKSIKTIRRFPHLSAFIKDDYVFRKFFIFETAKYQFFDIRDPFLGNIVNELKHVSMDQLDISYLNPDESNYEFLEMLANDTIPDINKLKTISDADIKYATTLVELSGDLLINT